MISFCKLIEDYKEQSETALKRELLISYLCECKEEELDSAVFLLSGEKRKRIITEESLIRLASEFSQHPLWLLHASIREVGDVAETLALTTGLPVLSKNWDLGSILNETERLRAEPELLRERLFFFWKTLEISEKTFLHSLLLGKRIIKVPEILLFSVLADCFDLELGILLIRYKRERPDLRTIPVSQILRSWFPDKKRTRLSKKEIAGRTDVSLGERKNESNSVDPVYSDDTIPDNYGFFWECPGIPVRAVGNSSGIFLWKEGENGDLLDPISFSEVYSACSELLTSGNTFSLTGVVQEDGNNTFIIYDILEYNGRTSANISFRERRDILSSLVGNPKTLAIRSVETNSFAKNVSIKEFYKLLMDKKSNAYLFDPTGNTLFLFLRPARSLKAVLLYGRKGREESGTVFWELGFGIRFNSISPEPRTIARIVLRNEDPFFAELDSFFQENTIEKKGPIRGVPTIWKAELSFQTVHQSKRHKLGFRLEGVRLVRRISEEETIDSLETLVEFWEKSL
ncbi:hypothetical protein EHQ12_01590 [Leptospira gomenensis]|uniref:DNA ligase (ATP) n=1 Tax=Leptospira gomenensis TaxID=2484974 RepID=A0A5F1YD68_9LEPT|nr:hypothetical protein [Leptospira gomenensis]TGK36013.1 hypothetical protein EHQ17_05405 [Leptospira gomenensis]TGK44455.1 hypothetical protein EHQ12_01590 [Leptospira gomenensis]TGK53383.1 hypothetical protein EHQ07_00325 [Leptospira gomenensis]TGK60682.1 hypothetical protein EHQ13_10735 [Leptospira gomenensis]